MAEILLRRVASFNRDQLLSNQVSGLRGRNSPFGRTRGNLLTKRARFLVSHIPMPYPNTIKQKSPQVYPLSKPVKGPGERGGSCTQLLNLFRTHNGFRCDTVSSSNGTFRTLQLHTYSIVLCLSTDLN